MRILKKKMPTKEIKIFKGDKECMSTELRKIRRQKSREYRKHKRSDKFIKLQKKFDEIKAANAKKNILKHKLKH